LIGYAWDNNIERGQKAIKGEVTDWAQVAQDERLL
jgi:hypothetical protein